MKNFEEKDYLQKEINKCDTFIKRHHETIASIWCEIKFLQKKEDLDEKIDKDFKMIEFHENIVSYYNDKKEFLNKILNLLC